MTRFLIALLLSSLILSCNGSSKEEDVKSWDGELSLLISKLSYNKKDNKVVLAE
jgi:uncharacterized lipoprotein YehR (DUF1307 family)